MTERDHPGYHAGGDLLAPPEPQNLVRSTVRPTFSVIIAAYEAEDGLAAAIESALRQTEPPLEVIVANDGSTDATAAVAEAYADRCVILSLPHRGESATKNSAASVAHGDFVVILDADDVWDVARLARLGDAAQLRPDLGLITTDAWFEVDGRRGARFYSEANTFPTVDQRLRILERNFFMSHVAVRREAWEAVGGFDEAVSYAADWDCWLRLLFTGWSAGCVMFPLASYRIWAGSLSARRPESLRARVDILDRAERSVQLTPSEREYLARSRTRHASRALLAEVEQALLERRSDARARCLALSLISGSGLRFRLKASAAAVAPRLAGHMLRRRQMKRGYANSARAVETQFPAA